MKQHVWYYTELGHLICTNPVFEVVVVKLVRIENSRSCLRIVKDLFVIRLSIDWTTTKIRDFGKKTIKKYRTINNTLNIHIVKKLTTLTETGNFNKDKTSLNKVYVYINRVKKCILTEIKVNTLMYVRDWMLLLLS